MTDEPVERQWNVQDGPSGPVEILTTFNYMRQWLQKNTAQYSDLLVKWCREHPEYVHDGDPRGSMAWGSGAPIKLDGGGFVSVVGEQHVGADGRRTTVKILRLPHRALTVEEARGIAAELKRLVKLADSYDTHEGAAP